jgi:hypothetical protein
LLDAKSEEGRTVLEWLENTSFSKWVVGESLLGWPLALTVHAIGTAVVIGFTFIIGLRLLGFFEAIPYSSLKRLFPVMWIAAVIQVASGVTMWMTKPTRYMADGAFVIKFSLVVISLVVTWYLQKILKRETVAWETTGTVPLSRQKFGVAACLLWAGVLIAGRLTAYLGALYAV